MRIAVMVMGVALMLAACGPSATKAADAPAASASTAASAAWDARLVDFLPAIDACIERAQGLRQVSYAGERDGAVLVRLQGEAPMDCSVNAGSDGTVVSVQPRDEALSVAGEGDAIFVRGPGENPGGECYEAPEVRDTNGNVIGWMLDPEGC